LTINSVKASSSTKVTMLMNGSQLKSTAASDGKLTITLPQLDQLIALESPWVFKLEGVE